MPPLTLANVVAIASRALSRAIRGRFAWSAWSRGDGPSRLHCATNSRSRPVNGRSRSPQGEDGGVLIAFLLFASLVVAGLSLYSIRWAQLWDSQRLRAECRAEMRATYDEVGEKIRDLIEMNQTVERLRIAEKAAYALLAASTATLFAPGITAATRALQMIRQMRKVLRARQHWLIQSANFKLLRIRTNVFQRLGRLPTELGLVRRELNPRFTLPVRAAVRKADQDPQLPKYELLPDFERRQKMELKWQSRYQGAAAPNRERTSPWKIANLELPESCGMTLENTGTAERPRFRARPTQDKYFWRR